MWEEWEDPLHNRLKIDCHQEAPASSVALTTNLCENTPFTES